jgi:hypothetical protein
MPGVTDKKESRGSGTYFPEVGAVEEEWHVCVCVCVCVYGEREWREVNMSLFPSCSHSIS